MQKIQICENAYQEIKKGVLQFEECEVNEEILSKSEDLLAATELQMKKVMDNRLTILNNSMMSVIRKYIEIHQI